MSKRVGQHEADKLLPCPFCGSGAHITADGDETLFYVACDSVGCFCAVGEAYDRDAMPNHVFVERGMAIKAWNTRVQAPAEQAAERGIKKCEHAFQSENGWHYCTKCRETWIGPFPAAQ